MVAGVVAGAAGGQVRDQTGRHLYEHYEAMPEHERERLFRRAAESAGTPAAAPDPSSSAALSRAELEQIPSSRAASDAVSCKICMDAQVTVSLLPCKHACTCARCLIQLMDRGEARCPVCRRRIEGAQRVYI
jgi:hypothetical protein